MKMILLSAIILSFTACKKEAVVKKDIDANFSVQVNKCRDFSSSKGALTVCLDSVIQDSRCPANANCVWAGYAAARFIVTKNGKRHVITLLAGPDNTGGKIYSTEASVMGYRIVFKELSPYPGLKPYNYADYIASLAITE